MQEFGFFSPIPIDYPREQMATSGIYTARRASIADPDRKVDVARVAIGQAAARTAAADGAGHRRDREQRRDDGAEARRQDRERVRPTSQTRRTRRSAARSSPQTASHRCRQSCSASSTRARAPTRQIGDLQVAGKTGTAQTGTQGLGGPPAVRSRGSSRSRRSSPEGGHRRRDRGLHRLRRNGRRTRRPRHLDELR
jgi:hypothetical protein